MRHTISRASIASLFLCSSLISASCSNSDFSQATGKASPAKASVGGSASSKANEEESTSTKALQDAEVGANQNPTLGIEGNAFVGAFETPISNDSNTLGCTLPVSVQKAMGAFVDARPAASVALTGWGGGPVSQSQLGLKNLDLNTCQWFQESKKDSVARYMILYTKDGQSHAQPFKLAANAITYAACISSAASASLATGGVVSCVFVPRG